MIDLVESFAGPVLDELGDDRVFAGIERDRDLVVPLLVFGIVVLMDQVVVYIQLEGATFAQLEFDLALGRRKDRAAEVEDVLPGSEVVVLAVNKLGCMSELLALDDFVP